MDEQYLKFCEQIDKKFNSLPADARDEIVLYTTRQQLLTLYQLKTGLKDFLPPKVVNEINTWMENTYEYALTMIGAKGMKL